jgi:dihydropyrimidinase
MNEGNDLVIRGGKIVTPDGVIQSDLAIKGAILSAIGSNLGSAKIEVSAYGKYVMPGGIDSHAYIEQISGMGQMNADTFDAATRSAAMGGTTSVISFAAQAGGQTISDTLIDYAARAQRGSMIDYAFHITITDTAVSDFEDDLSKLIAAGHRSLKVFTTYNIQLNDQEILKVLALARKYGALVCVHAENDAIIASVKEKLLVAGHISPRYHAQSHPRIAEIEAVERICRFAQYVDQPVMLFHISTAEGADRPPWTGPC